jgi:Calcium/calmodulin dependent protein kinase II association domain
MADDIAKHIVALERAALDRWGKGDPGGYLEINAVEVTYFDPFQETRLNGLTALCALYEQIRGKIRIDRDEMIDPRVQVIGGAAVLTFQFISQGSEGLSRWNCTEVYQQFDDDWKIVHSHWSFAMAGRPGQ